LFSYRVPALLLMTLGYIKVLIILLPIKVNK